jgi:glycosyltransferase involved in cell wall biosynthesis
MSSSRTIVYVIASLDLGGAERQVALVAPRLKKCGWDPIIYCLSRPGLQAGQIESAGVKVIGPRWEIGAGQVLVGRVARLIASAVKLFTLLLSMRPPIVHFFLPEAYLIGAPIAIAARVPIRVMSRRSLNHYQKKHPFLRQIERFWHPRMQMLLGNSEAVLKELRTETAVDSPIELIYNGADLSQTNIPSATPTDTQRNPGKLTLIIVANLIPYKGHADLFHAVASIAGKLPESWELLCVGRDDGLGAKLTELSRHLQLDGHIRLLGSRADVPALLASADIGILCSHEEGFSNAILEGMVAGVPMVVTNVGGNAEAVIDQKTGLVVPPHDPAALGAAILSLASNAELRKRMGKAGRRRAEIHFSLDQCVKHYDALYRDLMVKFGPAQAQAT